MEVVRNAPRRARGFTLVELITTTAVVTIALAVAVPSWAVLTQRNQVTTAANTLIANLRLARSTAVNRRTFVSLCPSSDGVACSGDPQGWQQGYLVFEDNDGDKQRSLSEPLLRVQGAAPALRLHSTAGRPAIRFRPDGAAWSTNTTFRVCGGDNPDHNRAVVLFGSGRARVDERAPGNQPVTCL